MTSRETRGLEKAELCLPPSPSPAWSPSNQPLPRTPLTSHRKRGASQGVLKGFSKAQQPTSRGRRASPGLWVQQQRRTLHKHTRGFPGRCPDFDKLLCRELLPRSSAEPGAQWRPGLQHWGTRGCSVLKPAEGNNPLSCFLLIHCPHGKRRAHRQATRFKVWLKRTSGTLRPGSRLRLCTQTRATSRFSTHVGVQRVLDQRLEGQEGRPDRGGTSEVEGRRRGCF